MTLDADARIAEETKTEGCGCGCGPARADTRSDCLDACEKAYNACMANAGSDLEKSVCHASYNKCITDC